MPYDWSTITEAATAITVAVGAGVAILGLAQQLASLGGKVGRASMQSWRRWRRERRARRRERRSKQRRRQNQ